MKFHIQFIFRAVVLFGSQNYIRITKCDRDGLQSAIGLRITKYDRAGLQIATKIKKNGLQSATGLKSATVYKVIQYK